MLSVKNILSHNNNLFLDLFVFTKLLGFSLLFDSIDTFSKDILYLPPQYEL